MIDSETFVRMSDGTELYARRYGHSSQGRNLVIVHGACEHSGRYQHVIQEFVERGWNVLAYDQRGHGRSSGVDTHVDHFDQYVDDLSAVCDHFKLPPEQTAVLGHSMGGLVAIRSAQTAPGRFQALVLSSPLLKVKVRVPYRTLISGRVLAWYAPETRFRSRVRPAELSHDKSVVESRKNDRLIRRSVTAGWYFAMRKAMRDAWRQRPSLSVPLLVLQSQADSVVCPKAPSQWIQQIASPDSSMIVVPDAYHELLSEPGWPDSIATMAGWLEPRVPQQLPFVVAMSDHSLGPGQVVLQRRAV